MPGHMSREEREINSPRTPDSVRRFVFRTDVLCLPGPNGQPAGTTGCISQGLDDCYYDFGHNVAPALAILAVVVVLAVIFPARR